MRTTLVWFRDDLRVSDNPALLAACEAEDTIGVFVRCEAQWREHGVGGRRLSFLRRSLVALAADLARVGIPLVMLQADRFTDVPARLRELVGERGAFALHFNAEYPLDEARRDADVARELTHAGIEVHRHHGGVILPPGEVVTAAGTPYTVFTPFKRRWLERSTAADRTPLRAPKRLREPISPLAIAPFAAESADVDALWPAGEAVAARRLRHFVRNRIDAYATTRNEPGIDGTSRLSPYLAVGAISARQCFAQCGRGKGPQTWLNELVWRDFYRHVIAAFTHVSKGRPFRRAAERIRWRHDLAGLAAWQRGETGYPLVDAGMRELAATGWMHNRLRMVTAMFLTKHLLIDWHEGERHFMELLVDGDFAANNGGWQWSASTGTDAAPYFRIFNPVTQAKRIDPNGAYVRRWIPELASVPLPLVFEPWRAPLDTRDYPPRIVEHELARRRALDAFSR